MVAAWDIYAKALFDLEYGHPLWAPEPSYHFGEIQIGDVGYVSEGRFMFLFNSTRPLGDPVNCRGVPDGHVPFEIPVGSLQVFHDHIAQPLLKSNGIYSVSVAGRGTFNGPFSAGGIEAGLRYRCTQQSGALLMLKDTGHSTRLVCDRNITQYMRKHLPRWYSFATDTLGIDLAESEIIFVSGYVKTTVWAEAAFNSRTSDGELFISGGTLGLPTGAGASGALSVSLLRCQEPVIFHRSGPSAFTRARISDAAGGSTPVSQNTYDQCIFLNYHAMKMKRFRSKVMRAAAGPHELPPDDPDASFETVISPHKISSFFDDILEAILEQIPDVDVACVSDRDMARLRSILCSYYVDGDPTIDASQASWDMDVREAFRQIPALVASLSVQDEVGTFEWNNPDSAHCLDTLGSLMLAPAPPPHMLSPTSAFSLGLDDAKQAKIYNTLINDLGAVKLEESSSQSDDSADQVVGFVHHDPVGESLGYVGDPTIFTSFTPADEVGQDAFDEAKARGVKAKCKHCDAEVASVSMESADDERHRYQTLAAVSPWPSSPRGYGLSIDTDDHSTQVCGVPVGVIEHSATFVDPTRSVNKGKVIELPVETRAAPADHLHRVVEFIVLQLFTALKRILDCPKGQREAVAELLGVALKLLSDSLAIYYAPPGRGKDAHSDRWCNLMNEPNFFPPFIYPLASFVGHLIYALNAPPDHFPSNDRCQPETLPFQFPSSAFTFTADTRGNVGQPDNSRNDGSYAEYSSAPGSTDRAISTQWDAHEHAHSLATSSTAGVVQHQHDTSGGISDAVCITHGAESEFVNEHLVQLAMLIVGLHQTDEALRRRILALCLFPDPNQSTELEGHADLLSRLLKLPNFRYSSDNNKSDTDTGRLPSHVRHHLLSNYLRVQGMGGIMRPSPSRAASTSTTDVLRVIPRTSDEVLSRLARLSWPVSNNRLLENWSLMLQMIRWHAEDKTGAERQAVP